MSAVDHELTIVVRSGMPANLLDLPRKFPRDQWAGEPSIHARAEGCCDTLRRRISHHPLILERARNDPNFR
jgi:hypothetical protein